MNKRKGLRSRKKKLAIEAFRIESENKHHWSLQAGCCGWGVAVADAATQSKGGGEETLIWDEVAEARVSNRPS